MPILTTKKRNSLKSRSFGLPKERKYPMPDKSHARNAKARASQQYNKGNITDAEKSKIFKKADKLLGKHKKEYVNGKNKNKKVIKKTMPMRKYK